MQLTAPESFDFTLLYVEDDPESRAPLRRALGTKYPQIRLLEAGDGAEGLALFKELRPEMVITDIVMPVLDGISMAAEIKAVEPETIVVATTAHCEANQLFRAIEVGINHYIPKPVDHRRLFAAIDDSLQRIASQRQLKSQNERIRALSASVEQNPNAVLIADARGIIDYVNGSYRELTGFSAWELLGRDLGALQIGSSPWVTHDAFWAAIQNGPWHGEFQSSTKDGSLYWEHVSIAPILNDAGVLTHVVVTRKDITERKLAAEELQRAHATLEQLVEERSAQLAATIADLEKEIAVRTASEEALTNSAIEIHDLYNNAYCGYHSIDADGLILHINDTELNWLGYFREEVVGKMHLADIVTKGCREQVKRNLELLIARGRVHDLQYDLKCADGRTIPVLVSATAVYDGNGSFLMSRSSLIDITERKKTEEELRESESLLRATFDNAPFELWVRDRDNCCVIQNAALVQHWGDLLGKRPADTCVPEKTRRVWEENNRRAFEGQVVQGEVVYEVEGASRVYENVVAPIRIGEEIRGIVGFNIDITDRKRSEQAMLRLSRLFETLYAANQAIIHAGDHDQLFREICRIVVEHGGFRMAWIGVVDEESGAIRAVASSGSGTCYLDGLSISVREEQGGTGPTGTAVREAGSVICNDFLNDPRTVPWHERAREHGFRSSAAFALRSFGKTLGAMTVYAGEPDCFDKHYIDLIDQLAADISFALESMELDRLRKDAVKEMELSREELKEAQRVAGAGNWRFDVPSGVVTWSDELYRIHGFKRHDPVPKYEDHDRLFAAESLARLQNAVEHTIATGEPYKLDLEIVRPDLTRRWITAHGEVVRGADGQATLLRGTSIDITERRRLEQQLLEAKRLEAIGQLAGGLAHEVRNPLNAILSISEALFREEGVAGNPEYEPYIQHIRVQVNRLAHLMNDLLDLGKPIPTASLGRVPLKETCQEAMKLLELSGVCARHSLALDWQATDRALGVVADGVKLQQVLANLLQNAVQHSPAGAEVVLLLPEPDRKSGMAVLQVRDAGSGIPPERLARVFEPFFSGRKGGTGLGLALVRHFVESMGGTVRIWNNYPPPGCTAEVRIPLAPEGS